MKDQVAGHKPVPAAPVDSLSPARDKTFGQTRSPLLGVPGHL